MDVRYYRQSGVQPYPNCKLTNAFIITDLTVECTLKGHSRLVTDMDWSDTDPNVLVTASHDNYLHVWDVRFGDLWLHFYWGLIRSLVLEIWPNWPSILM